MANRAIESSDSDDEVINLSNDVRWQARLADARAKRAIVLENKAKAKGPRPPRQMPWEDEDQNGIASQPERFVEPEAAEPLFEPHEDPFNLGISVRRSSRNGPQIEDNAPKSINPDKISHLTHYQPIEPLDFKANTVFDEPTFVRSSGHRDRAAVSLLLDPIPKGERGDHGKVHPRKPWLFADEVEQHAPDPAQSTQRQPKRTGEMPVGLAWVLVVMVALPFTEMLPPRELGPASPTTPAFGVQAALGMPTPMFEIPVTTSSREWLPRRAIAPEPPLHIALPATASMQREAGPAVFEPENDDSFETIAVGRSGVASEQVTQRTSWSIPSAVDLILDPTRRLSASLREGRKVSPASRPARFGLIQIRQ